MSKPDETVTFGVEGDIDLDTFAVAVDGLRQLAKSLAEDLVPSGAVEWELAGLELGSATVTLRPVSDSDATNRRIARRYREIGDAIADDQPLRFSDGVRKAAQRLARICDRPHVSSVRFVSQGHTATVSGLGRGSKASIDSIAAVGTVTGIVESISRRGDLHLTLIDDVFSGRVALHLTKGQKEIGRNAWDQHVTVTGLITENPGTGRPTDVRAISAIDAVPSFEHGAWRAARGAFPWQPGDPPAEQQLREIRGRA